jgi:hypothetical protein
METCACKNARAAFKRSGYRIILEKGNIPPGIGVGKPFQINLAWKNIGVAPTYENWDIIFELKDNSNNTVWSGQSKFRLKLFLPDDESTGVTDEFKLPANIAAGNYHFELIIKDPGGYRFPFPLAIKGRTPAGAYFLNEVRVTNQQ